MKKLSENFYQKLLENIDLGVYFVDNDRAITFFNKAAEKITGYRAEDVVGTYCHSNLLNHIDEDGNSLCLNGCPLHATIEDGKEREANVFLHHKEGHRVPVRVKSSRIVDENGRVVGAVETFYYKCKQLEVEEENEILKIQAMTDELTSLPNRRYLDEWLIGKHREFQKFKRQYGVLILDIDNFKTVNDTYGHMVGDGVLNVVAHTLKSATRANDIVGRFGGEEFTMVLAGITAEELHQIGKRLCSLVYNSTLEVGQENISVSVSIGGAVVKDCDTIKSLLVRADEQLYRAKSGGKNRICTALGTDILGNAKTHKTKARA